MPHQYLKMRDLLIGVNRAIRDRKLGYHDPNNGSNCKYRYNSGCGCHIGVNLEEPIIEVILKSQENGFTRRLNGAGISIVRNAGLVSFAIEESTDIAKLQELHDDYITGAIDINEYDDGMKLLREKYGVEACQYE